MSNPMWRILTKSGAFYMALALCLFTFTTSLWAEITAELTPKSQAIDHVLKNGGISLLVSIGTEDRYTGDTVGKAITDKFATLYDDVPITYFVRQSTGDYGYLEFYMRDIGSGPHGAEEWNTPEKAKALFENVYVTYLASLERALN